MMNSSPPPPVPLHQSTVYIPTFIQSHSKQDSLFRNSPAAKRDSDLSLVDYDSTASSSDESDTDGFRYSSESFQTTSDEHQFWQVHSSTTIIAPPTLASISMNYVNPKKKLKEQQPRKTLSLAAQVQRILGSTLDEVDEEIEKEWDQSRTQLTQTLIDLPNISFLSTQS
jgi:hypothetical protein